MTKDTTTKMFQSLKLEPLISMLNMTIKTVTLKNSDLQLID